MIRRITVVINALENDICISDNSPLSPSRLLIGVFFSTTLASAFILLLPICAFLDILSILLIRKESSRKSIHYCLCHNHERRLTAIALANEHTLSYFFFGHVTKLILACARKREILSFIQIEYLAIYTYSVAAALFHKDIRYASRVYHAFELLLLSRVVINHRCATTDHYQRYYYILAQYAQSLSVIQHGFFHEDMSQLPHSIQRLNSSLVVYARAPEFLERFATLYSCDLLDCHIFDYKKLLFDSMDTRPSLCFLSWGINAHSEVLLINSLLSDRILDLMVNIDLHVYYKLHPVHPYDNRDLNSLHPSVIVLSGNDDRLPSSNVYILYKNSFVQFELPEGALKVFFEDLTPSNIGNMLLSGFNCKFSQ